MTPIITSYCDLDFYKLTMMQAVYYYESNTPVEYAFICRTPNVDFREAYNEIKRQIEHICTLRFTEEELEYLGSKPYFKDSFIRYLRGFQLSLDDVEMSIEDSGKLNIRISGPWVNTILFETLIMSITSEVYFFYKTKNLNNEERFYEGRKRLADKIAYLKSYPEQRIINFSEFGTRRRFSKAWQEEMIQELIKSGYYGFVGTSNVYFAMKYNLRVIGTMAHEWQQAHIALTNIENASAFALNRWLVFYEGSLGTALTDTYTTDHFLSIYNGTLTRAFDGVRHDSGDPIEWGEKMIKHYQKHGVDPSSKLLLFSDGLNLEKAREIYEVFKGRVKVSFGIGTNLSNDMGWDSLNIVVKLVKCNGFPTIKISDSIGKCICEDAEFKTFALKWFQRNKR